MSFTEIIIFTVLIVVVESISIEKCPDIPVMANLNLTKLMETKVWYEQYYYENNRGFLNFGNSKCTQDIVSVGNRPGNHPFYQLMKSISLKTNKPHLTVFTSSYNPKNGHISMIAENDEIPWGPIDFKILLTDHVSYTLSSLCTKDKNNPELIYLIVKVATPCPNASPMDLREIKKLLAENGLGFVTFNPSKRENCSCTKNWK